MARVGTVLGTMEFGRGPCVGELPRAMVDTFLDFDATFREVDTAYMYTGGESETSLGKMERLKGFIHQLGFSLFGLKHNMLKSVLWMDPIWNNSFRSRIRLF
jgi:hypothetical protein